MILPSIALKSTFSYLKNRHFFLCACSVCCAGLQGTFDPEDCANRLKLLAKERRIIGCGLGSAKAFAKLNQGVDWRNCAHSVVFML